MNEVIVESFQFVPLILLAAGRFETRDQPGKQEDMVEGLGKCRSSLVTNRRMSPDHRIDIRGTQCVDLRGILATIQHHQPQIRAIPQFRGKTLDVPFAIIQLQDIAVGMACEMQQYQPFAVS